jgi:hypothetical protein
MIILSIITKLHPLLLKYSSPPLKNILSAPTALLFSLFRENEEIAEWTITIGEGYMKRINSIIQVLYIVAFTGVTYSSIIQETDSLLSLGGIHHTGEALKLIEKGVAGSPGDFELHWKAASVCRDYAAALRQGGDIEWEKKSARLGKKGMVYAEKAMAIAPDSVEGYFYYGVNVGVYADGVSVLTALKEGLKGKTQSNLEKAYQINRRYKDGGPAFALGRFWAVVPWPFQDRKKALKYYREYQKLNHDNAYWEERSLNLAEFLADRGKEHRTEARELLKKVTAGPNKYLAERAQALLEKISGK